MRLSLDHIDHYLHSHHSKYLLENVGFYTIVESENYQNKPIIHLSQIVEPLPRLPIIYHTHSDEYTIITTKCYNIRSSIQSYQKKKKFEDCFKFLLANYF